MAILAATPGGSLGLSLPLRIGVPEIVGRAGLPALGAQERLNARHRDGCGRVAAAKQGQEVQTLDCDFAGPGDIADHRSTDGVSRGTAVDV